MQKRRLLAVALADAFLAGRWTPAGLATSGWASLGVRHRWLARLAAEVLSAYQEPPLDRPRELAAYIELTDTLDEVERRASALRRPFPVARHRITVPTEMTRRPFPVVPLDHAGSLAELLGCSMSELLWFADTKRWLRRGRAEPLQHYRSRWVPTGSGGVRLLEAPKPRLRELQRQVLEQLLAPIPVHPSAHGFVAGRSEPEPYRTSGPQW